MALAAALCIGAPQGASAHDGPPYPIVSDQAVGPYLISVWTDPDTTDDGTAGGQFWVTFGRDRHGAQPRDVNVTIAATPARGGPWRSVDAVVTDTGSHFGALVLDHEGRFRIDVQVRGPRGDAEITADVDATYDLRPAPIVVALYAVPFVLAGALWIRILMRRRGGHEQ
jgi:hypothetical protein